VAVGWSRSRDSERRGGKDVPNERIRPSDPFPAASTDYWFYFASQANDGWYKKQDINHRPIDVAQRRSWLCTGSAADVRRD
jgi:hypothetical protein